MYLVLNQLFCEMFYFLQPALAKYQAEQQREAILERNRIKLLNEGWKPPKQEKKVERRKRFATVATAISDLTSKRFKQKACF